MTIGSASQTALRLGPSVEMRRFSAGIRAIIATLCTFLLSVGEDRIQGSAIGALLAYDIWAAYVIWAEAGIGAFRRPLLLYWIDVCWTIAILNLTRSGTMMMVLTLVQPVVLASIGFGVRHGVGLALFAAAGMMLNVTFVYLSSRQLPHDSLFAALAVLALVPLAAMLSRPMSVLRQRLQLVRTVEDSLDPRRGLDAMGFTLVESLRTGLGADLVGLALRYSEKDPFVIGTTEGPAFRVSPATQRQMEQLLVNAPPIPCTHVVRRWAGLRGGTRLHGGGRLSAEVSRQFDELARLLELKMLVIVPLSRYEHRYGHLIVGLHDPRTRMPEVAALADAAPELLRLVEQASLVDQLQEESAAHERARIGRDLHDSAIQPYLGLKYAVEGVVNRVAFDNPARADIESLMALVTGEVAALREIISGLRAGEAGGDDSLLPAVRRQVRRFALLFGIDVELHGPQVLRTSRALAGELFHMINESLNNVRKHTRAQKITIELSQEPNDIVLTVCDDGGTVAGRPEPDFQPRSLQERVSLLGGSLKIGRPDGFNTEIVIAVPNAAVHGV